MIRHRTRIAGLVLVALIEACVLVLPLLGYADEATASTIAKAVLGVAVAFGMVDAAIVERARLDPSRSALQDDVVDEASE